MTPQKTILPRSWFATLLSLTACFTLLTGQVRAQQTAGGTQIRNQASATYTDGTGTSYTTVSNTVTVTVANVSSLTITPDSGTRSAVVPGQQNVIYTFTVTNAGNFSDQVRFLANGQSIQVTGSGTVAAAVIDVNNNGAVDAGDTNIFTNGADVISTSISQNSSITVLVAVNIANNAASNSTVLVQLGDATTGTGFDNQAANSSSHEVRTVASTSVNGLREARGDVSATVSPDAQLRLNLTAPTGPVALGSNITYTWQACNTGLNTANSITLVNGPAGSNSGVYIIAPIPANTQLASGQTFPAGTLYSTTALTTSPLNATYTTTAPAALSDVRRVAFYVGATLAGGACGAQIPMDVTITAANSSVNIYEIGDTFATNTLGVQITDQSGDNVSGVGDGNGNFDEGVDSGDVDGNGIQLITTLQQNGEVILGPLNYPNAVGPTSNNDDFTNRSVTKGIAEIEPGAATTDSDTIIFRNTIRNGGNANDNYAVSVQSVPAGFTVAISLDGTTYTNVSVGGATVTVPVTVGADRSIYVRVSVPSGLEALKAGGYPVVLRATSGITPTQYNETIDRVYTGFVRLDKAYTIINQTGSGGATDAVPGAMIEYAITYQNISTTGGTGNAELTATNVVITEDGADPLNNWAATTTQVVGSASDTRNGTITGDTANSTVLTDTVPTLAPQQSGIFKFRRLIR